MAILDLPPVAPSLDTSTRGHRLIPLSNEGRCAKRWVIREPFTLAGGLRRGDLARGVRWELPARGDDSCRQPDPDQVSPLCHGDAGRHGGQRRAAGNRVQRAERVPVFERLSEPRADNDRLARAVGDGGVAGTRRSPLPVPPLNRLYAPRQPPFEVPAGPPSGVGTAIVFPCAPGERHTIALGWRAGRSPVTRRVVTVTKAPS